MTLDDLLTNERLRHAEFPVTRDRVFLAHAAVSPLPRRVTDAIQRYAAAASLNDQEEVASEQIFLDTRVLAARLLGAHAEEVAFVGPTSLALSYVASGWPLSPGDNVVVYFDDYPSNVYPWMALAERGVEVRFLELRQPGCIQADDVLGRVNGRTRLVALASCHFVTGHRIDLEPIGRGLRERQIAFCLDAIQTLGAFPTPVAHADFLAADAHKWLLGPCGAGLLYVRRELQDRLRPPIYGWHNVRCPGFVAQERLVHPPDGRRYEAGTANLLGLVGLQAALELLLDLGIENIARELLRKRAWLVPALQARGYTVLNADAPPETASAIVSCWRPDTDLRALHQRLAAEGVVASLRGDRSGRSYLRLSPHFYNTDAELRRAVELL
jgi:selenocysteine lyase/cysteine desulfurase